MKEVLLLAAIATTLAGTIAGAAVLYSWILLAASFVPRREKRPDKPVPPVRFLVVVPAHDEAATLPKALPAILAMRAPGRAFRVVVVADNCTDGTAAVARSFPGVEVLERHEPQAPGKDQALAWALARLAREDWDALLVLDADTRPRPSLLTAFARGFTRGYVAQQAAYDRPTRRLPAEVIGPSFLGLLGRYAETRVFYAGKERLGLAVLLLGNGMCFARETLERVPPPVGSTVEDVTWSLQLHAARIRPHLVEDALLETVVPTTPRALSVQRQRWAGGTLRLLLTRVPGALFEGVARGNPLLFDAAFTLIAANRPLVLLLGLLGAGGTVLARTACPGTPLASWPVVALAGVFPVPGLLAWTVAVAWSFAGFVAGTLGLLRAVPAAGVTLLATVRSFLPGRLSWKRTPRDDGNPR